MFRHFKSITITALVAMLFVTACSDSDSPSTIVTPDPPAPDPLPGLKADAAVNYADIVFSTYWDSYATATALKAAIDAFVATPTEATLAAARTAWLEARVPYGQTEAFRFYNGPIDNEDNGPEGRLNAWPMDENYVDYVAGFPQSGIINDTTNYPELSKELIAELNEKDGEANISTGYHAIEFLLWGQDLSADGPGNRPLADYLPGDNNHADRRAQYLTIVTDLLLEDLDTLVNAWNAEVADNYRASFIADADLAVTYMMQGIGGLSGAELSGERMSVALDTRDQEDEHSCFSDNTHVDILQNAQGIVNVYLGTYTTVDGTIMEGTGLSAIVTEVDADLDARVRAQLEAAIEACNNIPVPFDRALVDADGRTKVQNAVDQLRAVTELLVEVADALDITLNLEV